MARLEAEALLQTLNAALLSHDSATLTLDSWCQDHRMAFPAAITAARVLDADKPVTAEIRATLAVKPAETVRYRRVRLRCGDKVLSDADNWYVPSRLTPEMNRALDTTDIPFGRAVKALHFQRRTLSATVLWSPLPKGWEMNPPAALDQAVLAMPYALIEHRAVLTSPDGVPVSEVVETYTREVLDFPAPGSITPRP